MDLIVNYNGVFIDYRDVGSGYIDVDKGELYFLKLAEGLWETVSFSPEEKYNQTKIDKVNMVKSLSGGSEVSARFMELLGSEFPSNKAKLTDAEMLEWFKLEAEHSANKVVISRGKYYSDKGAVIVDGSRYDEGQVVYFKNSRYIVEVDRNGEGYLELDDYITEGEGTTRLEGTRQIEQDSRYINYKEKTGTITFSGLDLLVEYTNQLPYNNGASTMINSNNFIERKLKAPSISDLAYWECFNFTPGFKTVIQNSSQNVNIPSIGLSSKASPPPPAPPKGYADYRLDASKSGIDGGIRHATGFTTTGMVELKNARAFRVREPSSVYPWEPSHYAIWYQHTNGGFNAIFVPHFYGWKLVPTDNYSKAKKIYKKHGSWYSEAFLNDLKSQFGSSYISYSGFVRAYTYNGKFIVNWLKNPSKEPTAPNIKKGSGSFNDSTKKFYSETGSFDLTVRYATLLQYSGDNFSRGTAKLSLVKYNKNGSFTIIDTLFNTTKNFGNYWDINKGSVAVSRKIRGKGAGDYGFYLELVDSYQDTRTIGVVIYPSVTKLTNKETREYDDSSFTFSIVDAATGSPVSYEGKTKTVLKGAEIRQCFRVVVPKGKEYIVKGTLKRGSAAKGGILGDGGSVRASEGVVKYDLISRTPPIFVSDSSSIGTIIGEPPIGWTDEQVEGPQGDDGEKENTFCWVDAIEVTKYPDRAVDDDTLNDLIDNVACYPLGTEVQVDIKPEYGIDWSSTEKRRNLSEFLRVNSDLESLYTEDDIEIVIKNPLDEIIGVDLDFDVVDNYVCGGGGYINYFNVGYEYWGTGEFIGKDTERLPSYVRVIVDEYMSEHEILGGCPGCSAEIKLKADGKVVKIFHVDEGGWAEINTGNLYEYGTKDLDIEIVTYQAGTVDPRGYDLRCTFILDQFDLEASYDLVSTNYDSTFGFSINDEPLYSSDVEGRDVLYYPVKRGNNKYKFTFSTNHWDYNWDFAEVDWIRLTNWICDSVPVVPYCEPGGGDKCVEALIGFMLDAIPKPKPDGCAIIRHLDYDTKEIIKQEKRDGLVEGEYTFEAISSPDFKVVGDSTKIVYVKESKECTLVEFYYKRLYRNCIYVLHQDTTSGLTLLKEEYLDLQPGEYSFKSKEFEGYKLISESIKTIAVENVEETPVECKLVIFEYEDEREQDPNKNCIIVKHQEVNNPNNILATKHYTNVIPGTYNIYGETFKGYEIIGETEKEVIVEDPTFPINSCIEVTFEYRKIDLGCVVVRFKDRVNGVILDTDYYYNLPIGEYSFEAKEFDRYKLVSEPSKTILVSEGNECKEVVFLYESLIQGCAIGKKIWLFT